MSTRSLASRLDKRLVEQEHAGLAHQRAAHRDALALAARKLARPALEQMLDLQRLGDVRHRLVALRLGNAAHFHAEGHVLRHRHVGIERVGLEHHRDVALGGVQIVDRLAVDADLAGADRFEAGDRVEQGRLAAARGADEHEEAALVEGEVDALEDFDARRSACASALISRKAMTYPFTAPAISPRTK